LPVGSVLPEVLVLDGSLSVEIEKLCALAGPHHGSSGKESPEITGAWLLGKLNRIDPGNHVAGHEDCQYAGLQDCEDGEHWGA